MKAPRLLRFRCACLLSILPLLVGCAAQPERTPLKVFIAGSLVVPFGELERGYEAQHPEIDVQVEAHGSIQVIRHVTEIHEAIDLVVPADAALIPLLMYPASDPESGLPYAAWNLSWSGSRLVLAYTEKSGYAQEIDDQNWFDLLARPEVRFGLADPRLDAAGYRTLMIVQLAEGYYHEPALFESIFLGRFKEAVTVQKDGGTQVIHVPELLETFAGSNIYLRSGSVALLALLEAGEIDYTFEYESVARQHGLAYVALPPELNLGDPELAAQYQAVRVHLDLQRFASVQPSFRGEPVTYGLTIPSNAPHPAEAEAFVSFLFSPQGRQIMEANQHPIWSVPQVDHPAALPASLQALFP